MSAATTTTHTFSTLDEMIEFRKLVMKMNKGDPEFREYFKPTFSHQMKWLEDREKGFIDSDEDELCNKPFSVTFDTTFGLPQFRKIHQERETVNRLVALFKRRFLFVGDEGYFISRFTAGHSKHFEYDLIRKNRRADMEEYLRVAMFRDHGCVEGTIAWTRLPPNMRWKEKRGPGLVASFALSEVLLIPCLQIPARTRDDIPNSAYELDPALAEEEDDAAVRNFNIMLTQTPPYTDVVFLGDDEMIPLIDVLTRGRIDSRVALQAPPIRLYFPVQKQTSPYFNFSYNNTKHVAWNCGGGPNIHIVPCPGGKAMDICAKAHRRHDHFELFCQRRDEARARIREEWEADFARELAEEDAMKEKERELAEKMAAEAQSAVDAMAVDAEKKTTAEEEDVVVEVQPAAESASRRVAAEAAAVASSPSTTDGHIKPDGDGDENAAIIVDDGKNNNHDNDKSETATTAAKLMKKKKKLKKKKPRQEGGDDDVAEEEAGGDEDDEGEDDDDEDAAAAGGGGNEADNEGDVLSAEEMQRLREARAAARKARLARLPKAPPRLPQSNERGAQIIRRVIIDKESLTNLLEEKLSTPLREAQRRKNQLLLEMDTKNEEEKRQQLKHLLDRDGSSSGNNSHTAAAAEAVAPNDDDIETIRGDFEGDDLPRFEGAENGEGVVEVFSPTSERGFGGGGAESVAGETVVSELRAGKRKSRQRHFQFVLRSPLPCIIADGGFVRNLILGRYQEHEQDADTTAAAAAADLDDEETRKLVVAGRARKEIMKKDWEAEPFIDTRFFADEYEGMPSSSDGSLHSSDFDYEETKYDPGNRSAQDEAQKEYVPEPESDQLIHFALHHPPKDDTHKHHHEHNTLTSFEQYGKPLRVLKQKRIIKGTKRERMTIKRMLEIRGKIMDDQAALLMPRAPTTVVPGVRWFDGIMHAQLRHKFHVHGMNIQIATLAFDMLTGKMGQIGVDLVMIIEIIRCGAFHFYEEMKQFLDEPPLERAVSVAVRGGEGDGGVQSSQNHDDDSSGGGGGGGADPSSKSSKSSRRPPNGGGGGGGEDDDDPFAEVERLFCRRLPEKPVPAKIFVMAGDGDLAPALHVCRGLGCGVGLISVEELCSFELVNAARFLAARI